MARAATEDPKLENGTAQGSEEQLLAGPLPDSPLAEGQSPFEALRRKREGIEVEKQIQLEIPGYEGNLAARYKSLGYREIRKQAKRIASKGGDEAENEVTRFRDRPRGLLRVSVGTAFGMHQLVPALPGFLERYPEIELELSITDRRVDIVEENMDLAIRYGALADSSLIARRVCDLWRTICASPAYLERHGTPRTPDELQQHNCLYISTMPELRRWPFDTAQGTRIIEVGGKVGSDSAETLLQLAVMGVGIIRLADNIVGAEIARGALVPILTDSHHVEPVPLHIVYPHGRHRSPKVTALVDFLIENFAHAPWRAAWQRRGG